MTVDIVIIGDTHVSNLNDFPKKMIGAIEKADWVIHVGDYTSIEVLEGLKNLKGERFKGVFGNADPLSIRETVPSKDIIEINTKRIGITHTAFGGSIEPSKRQLLAEFKEDNVEIILYGHTHEAKIEKFNEILFINPGKGYLDDYSFGPGATYAILNIDEQIKVDIKKI